MTNPDDADQGCFFLLHSVKVFELLNDLRLLKIGEDLDVLEPEDFGEQ